MPIYKCGSCTTSPRSAHIGEMVRTKLREQQLEPTEDLTRDWIDMCLATASTDAICQLKKIITTIRQRDGLTVSQKPSNIAETIRILESLEEVQQVAWFLHRVYLLKLWKLRAEIEDLLRDGGSTKSGIGRRPKQGTGKVVSNVFDHLLAEAYPEISCRPQGAKEINTWRDKYSRERKALRSRFHAGKKWNLLSDTFPCGVLALVLSGGEFNITNNRYVDRGASLRSC